jgi:hypothetical protein
MQVYVIGSLNQPAPTGTSDEQEAQKQAYEQERQRFEAACRALGYALVKAGHRVRVGLSAWGQLEKGTPVSQYVIEGASQAAGELKRSVPVAFDVPRNPRGAGAAFAELETLEHLPHLELRVQFLRVAPSGVSLTQDIEQSDAFIIVGGGSGTDRLGYAAYQMRKPVVALTSFGRAGQAIHQDVLYDEYSDALAAETGCLHQEWEIESGDGQGVPQNRAHGDAVVGLMARLAGEMGARSRQGWGALGGTIAASCVLLVAWVALYLGAYSGKLIPSIVFFALLFISAALGTGLRVLVDYQRGQVARLYWRWLLVELAVALMLAFGLALIYLIGGISFTGSVVVLEPSASDGSFSTVALSMSLLGLAAGFLAPIEKLRQRLEKAIEESPEGGAG